MGEVDVSQIHFTMAFAWMDRGLTEWLADVGWPFTRLLQEGVGIPIVDSGCRFDQRILLDDMITIETSVGGIGNTSFRSRHRFLRGDELCAEGELTHVCIERGGRTPVYAPRPREAKGPQRCRPCYIWLPDLGSNQGHTD